MRAISLLYFALASGLGAVTRHLINRQARKLFAFPVGILFANTTGSFLLGLFIGGSSDLAFAGVGFCGAFTTWSAFALDLDQERSEGKNKEFFINIALNFIFAVAAFLLARSLFG